MVQEPSAPWGDGRAAYRADNHANWDERALLHAQSSDYDIEHLVADPTALSDVVAYDAARLGDIAGLSTVHLQCHIGTDSVSLARLGARVTGLDFSGSAVAAARTLAQRCGVEAAFVEGDAYDAVRLLGSGTFDLVYTGIGALCWLPRIDEWARVVSGLLRIGGRLFLREGHPMLWAIDERVTDALVVGYPYSETSTPVTVDEAQSYVSTARPIAASTSHSWNHGLGEIITALLEAGMEITSLTEHDSLPWEALPGQMRQDERGNWQLLEGRERLPLAYTLTATRVR